MDENEKNKRIMDAMGIDAKQLCKEIDKMSQMLVKYVKRNEQLHKCALTVLGYATLNVMYSACRETGLHFGKSFEKYVKFIGQAKEDIEKMAEAENKSN